MPDLGTLLERTSRTLALAIPLLPEPTNRQVTVAYLLFRMADSFEDSTRWSREARVRALCDFRSLLVEPAGERAERLGREWSADPPIEHEGYAELLAETRRVVGAYRELSTGARAAIGHHVGRTCQGMARFVEQADPEMGLELRDVEELRQYCYVVAGIVGEMLTELFLLDRPHLSSVRSELESRARSFGEALQLTNILKDSFTDANEGRRYVGGRVTRDDALRLAREGLRAAAEYTHHLQDAGADRGLVAFNALPVLLASATLDRVEERGPGSKITRDELWNIVDGMNRALEAGEHPIDLTRHSVST